MRELRAVFLSVLLSCAAFAQDAPSPHLNSAVGVPHLIRFAGKVANAAGSVSITFTLHKSQDDNVALWVEIQNVALDRDGRYNVLLGATKTEGVPADIFTSGEAEWLGVRVEGQAEQPRVLLVSVPYALRAAEADTLAGHAVTEFVTADNLSTAVQQQLKLSVASGSFNVKGKSSVKNSVASSGATNFTDSTTNQVVLVTQNGIGSAIAATASNGNGVTGTATAAAGIGVAGINSATIGVPIALRGSTVADNGISIYGTASGTGGSATGVKGITAAPGGYGVFGQNTATSGPGVGFRGTTASTTGIGIYGTSTATSGTTVGLRTSVASPDGISAVFQNSASGKLISGQTGAGNTEVFAVDGAGNVTTSGGLTASGTVTGSALQMQGQLFDWGSYSNANAYTGWAGNSGSTGAWDTAGGVSALQRNTSGTMNTAYGYSALSSNTLGQDNTAIGGFALNSSIDTNNNTAIGYQAGYYATGFANLFVGVGAGGFATTGSGNTFLGVFAAPGNVTISNAIAIGFRSEVDVSNALVLGGIKGVNSATDDTLVGVGTTAPTYKLHVGTINKGLRVEGPPSGTGTGVAISVGGYGDVGIDAPGVPEGRFVVKEVTGFTGIGTAGPDAMLTVNGTVDKPGGGSWGTFSDRRLKDLDGTYSSGLSQVMKIQPVKYRYKADNGMGIKDHDEHVGVVAQEIQQAIPEAVTTNNKGYLLVNNDPVIWAMLNAIKEQQKEITALKGQLKQRTSREAALERRVKQLEGGGQTNRQLASAQKTGLN